MIDSCQWAWLMGSGSKETMRIVRGWSHTRVGVAVCGRVPGGGRVLSDPAPPTGGGGGACGDPSEDPDHPGQAPCRAGEPGGAWPQLMGGVSISPPVVATPHDVISFFWTATAASGHAQAGASTSPAPSRPGPAYRADESAGGGGAGRGRGLGGHGGGACTSPGPGEGGATPHPARLSTAQPGLGPARRAGP